MKENINNNIKEISNNKLNLPTTWTKKKMASLLLMGWLSVNGVEAGKGFENCIGEFYTSANQYSLKLHNFLTSYPFDASIEINNGETITFCCGGIDNPSPCSLKALASCSGNDNLFYCKKISNTIFCSDAVQCGGVVGNIPITTNVTIGNQAVCNNFIFIVDNEEKSFYDKMEDQFEGAFSSCPVLWKNSSGYATWRCIPDSGLFGEICHWDSGGWSCFDFSPLNASLSLSKSTHVSSDLTCYIQYQTSPDYLNPMAPSPITTTILISPSSPVILSQSPNDPNLAEKIAIPVATTAGVVGAGGLAYLIYKKKKKKLLLIAGSGERRIAEISNSDEGAQEVVNEEEKENSSHEIAVAGPSRSQPKTKEDNEQLKEEMKKLKARLERIEQNQGLESQIQAPLKK